MPRYVATRTFRDVDGQPILEGQTHVSDQAEVYQRYPGRFRLIDSDPFAGRLIRTTGRATVGNGLTRSAPTETAKLPLFLETIPATSMVRLSSTAVRAMRRECRDMWLHCKGDMAETGGWLLSHRQWPDRVVVATQPGGDATHWRSRMRLGTESLERVQDFLPHLSVTGSWHVHPGDDDGTPSVADRQAWARWRELDGGYHIGVILHRGDASGWTNPQTRAWLTTAEFCEQLAWKEF